jgi:hypothetical protein
MYNYHNNSHDNKMNHNYYFQLRILDIYLKLKYLIYSIKIIKIAKKKKKHNKK